MTDDHATSENAEPAPQTQPTEPSPAAAVTTPIAPPTVAGPIGNWRPQSIWPRVIGIIGIILGVFGALQGLSSIVSTVMQLFVGGAISADPDAAETGEVFDRMAHWAPWNIASGSLLFLVAFLLFIGSIGLLMRRPWARTLCLTWAYCKIIAAMFSAVIVLFMQRDLMLAISNAQAQGGGAPPPPPAFMTAFTTGIPIIGSLVTLLWFSAFPIFIIVWFYRSKIREECAEWAHNN